MTDRNDAQGEAGRGAVPRDLRPLRAALPYLRPYAVQITAALACLLIASMAALAMPVAIRYVIDYGFSGEHASTINRYFLSLLVLGVVFAVFAGLRHYTVMWIGERFVADLRRRVFEHVILLDPRFFETTSTGEVLSRLTTDTTLVQTVCGAGMSIALRSLVMLIGALIMLFVTSPRLTSMIFLLLPLVVLPVLVYGRKVRKLSRLSQDRVADTSGIAGESLNAIQVIQAFVLESVLARRYRDAVEDAFTTARRRLLTSALLSGTIVLTAFSAIIVVLWLGARAVITGTISPGTLGQFLLYAVFVAGGTTALGEVGVLDMAVDPANRLWIVTPAKAVVLNFQENASDESLFNYTGMGWLTYQALLNRDVPLIQATIFVIAAVVMLTNLIVDVLYVLVDPRIRLG